VKWRQTRIAACREAETSVKQWFWGRTQDCSGQEVRHCVTRQSSVDLVCLLTELIKTIAQTYTCLCLKVAGLKCRRIWNKLERKFFICWRQCQEITWICQVVWLSVLIGPPWRPRDEGAVLRSKKWKHVSTTPTNIWFIITPWSWALLENPPVVQLLKNFPQNFMKPKGSLTCSQEPSTSLHT
jgi:hypothetical protein